MLNLTPTTIIITTMKRMKNKIDSKANIDYNNVDDEEDK